MKKFIISIIITIAMFSIGYSKPNTTDWVCIIHPESINQRVFSDKVIHIYDSGYVKSVWAKKYIQTEWRSYNTYRQENALIAAIRYSIANTSGGEILSANTFLDRYFWNSGNNLLLPRKSLQELLFTYTFSENQNQKNYSKYWLLMIAQSPENIYCNPWKNYR